MLHKFSPRKRRCFCSSVARVPARAVFSAQAEVFPRRSDPLRILSGFLRASGGVSGSRAGACSNGPFSPRKRRCFRPPGKEIRESSVFSAQAEVFLLSITYDGTSWRFLRASGGVSLEEVGSKLYSQFSPRKRRCFRPCYARG